jgi:multicomponent Na+:H+ antiporter subunit G
MLNHLLQFSAIIFDVIGYFLVSVGVFFALSGAVGIIRMPDFFSRIHSAGMIDSSALIFVVIGAIFLQHFSIIISLKLLILMVFGLILNATSCSMMAKSYPFAAKEEDFKGKNYKRNNSGSK